MLSVEFFVNTHTSDDSLTRRDLKSLTVDEVINTARRQRDDATVRHQRDGAKLV